MSKSTYAATANQPQPKKRYPSDCIDAEWAIIAPFTAKPHGPGRNRTVNLREATHILMDQHKVVVWGGHFRT